MTAKVKRAAQLAARNAVMAEMKKAVMQHVSAAYNVCSMTNLHAGNRIRCTVFGREFGRILRGIAGQFPEDEARKAKLSSSHKTYSNVIIGPWVQHER